MIYIREKLINDSTEKNEIRLALKKLRNETYKGGQKMGELKG